jgi:hypothetical protein
LQERDFCSIGLSLRATHTAIIGSHSNVATHNDHSVFSEAAIRHRPS